MLVKLIVEILLGALAGWFAGKLMKSKHSFWANVVIGLVGGLIGGLIGNLLGIGGGWLSGLILAVVGACLLLWIIKKLK